MELTTINYQPSELTMFLHSFPHFNFKFKLLEDPQFTFDDADYLQSIAMIALMPVVLLLITMIGFLFFYCCIGVKRAAPNKTNSSACYCSVCLMIMFIMLALGGIGVSVYGNIQSNDGIKIASASTYDINQSFSTITVEIMELNENLEILTMQSETLTEIEQNSNSIALDEAVQKLNEFSEELPDQTIGANDRLEWAVHLFEIAEWHRFLITFVLIGVEGVVCMLALGGICFRSKCLLITTTFIGLVCLVASYLYIGIDLMLDVALADLCMDPYAYIQSQAVEKLYMDNITAEYYLACSQQIGVSDLYADTMTEAMSTVAQVESILHDFNDTATKELVEAALLTNNQLSATLDSLSQHLECKEVNQALNEFVPAICGSTVEGFFVLACSLLITCFAFTAMLCAAPKTWKRFSKAARHSDHELDLDDVFLPPPVSSRQSRTNNPLYVAPEERYSRRLSHQSNTNLPAASHSLSFFRRSEEDVSLLEQPPPYSPPRPRSSVYSDE